MTKSRIPKISFFEPRKNLPGKASNPTNDESRFTIQFARAYLQQFEFLHHKSPKTSIACAREIHVNGFGIADLVTIAWDANRIDTNSPKYDSSDFITRAKPTVRAFEMKLSNWRRALMQASRYKYFANVSIVVLPMEKCEAPLKYIDTFRKIRIGLWGFDPDLNRIIIFYGPKPNKPLYPKCQFQALRIASSAAKSLPIV